MANGVRELRERLVNAEANLRALAAQREGKELYRITGKAEGVALALSYTEELNRGDN